MSLLGFSPLKWFLSGVPWAACFFLHFKEKICDLVHFFIFCFIPEKGTEQWREKKESEEETWNGEGYWKS